MSYTIKVILGTQKKVTYEEALKIYNEYTELKKAEDAAKAVK
jgi:hypothetical protein